MAKMVLLIVTEEWLFSLLLHLVVLYLVVQQIRFLIHLLIIFHPQFFITLKQLLMDAAHCIHRPPVLLLRVHQHRALRLHRNLIIPGAVRVSVDNAQTLSRHREHDLYKSLLNGPLNVPVRLRRTLCTRCNGLGPQGSFAALFPALPALLPPKKLTVHAYQAGLVIAAYRLLIE